MVDALVRRLRGEGDGGPPAAVAPAAEPPLAAPEPAQTPDQTVVGQGSQRS
jgi:hypothetical protein